MGCPKATLIARNSKTNKTGVITYKSLRQLKYKLHNDKVLLKSLKEYDNYEIIISNAYFIYARLTLSQVINTPWDSINSLVKI